MKRRLAIGLIGIGLVAVAGALTTYVISRPNLVKNDASEQRLPSLINKKALDALPQVQRSSADISRLASGVTPPTNTWFSGLALQKVPEPVFSYPNSIRPTNSGFELGLPDVSATADSVTGPHAADVIVTIADANNYKIARYDELTVDLGYYSSDDKLVATVTLAAGSPYVYVNAQQATTLSYGDGGVKKADAFEIMRGNKLYGVRTSEQQSDESSLQLPARSSASFFSLPNKAAFPTVAKYALNTVTSGGVSYAKRGPKTVTTLDYKTNNNQPTLVARLPHQHDSSVRPSGVTYESILGPLATIVSSSLEYSVPNASIVESLPIHKLPQGERAQLSEQLTKDVGSLGEPPADTYFGGKDLQRTAQLLLIADQLGAQSEKSTLQKRLKTNLTEWLSENGAFQYDTKAHAIVGKQTSFGADTETNDHHFHYGYVIYAAAVLARFDDSFRRDSEAAVNLLVADIANYKSDEELPQRRNYDAYFGHSWASGTAPFKDGNNQESVSEAMNAWAGVGLWAKQINNDALVSQAEWMLSNETASAKEYWLKRPVEPGYSAPIASIVWGGKREYKTFFSDDANPKLSIQLLPLNPSMQEYTSTLPQTAFTGTDVSRSYGDYILMARPDATIGQAKSLPDLAIDDGNSRTYLYAYVMTKQLK